MRILLTRPEPDAQRTAAALRALGHDVTVLPLLRIEVLPDADLGGGPWAAILVTSANAAHAIARHARGNELRAVPVFAVGVRSAQAMRETGFADVTSADGNVDDLARLVDARMKPGAMLLYLAGEARSGDLASALRAQDFAVRTVVVYRAAPTENPRLADALAGGVDTVLHFSRRSAEAYVSAARAAGLAEATLKKLNHFCLSAPVAEPLNQAGAVKVHVAARPDEGALIELLKTA